jgi:hypothetical protein
VHVFRWDLDRTYLETEIHSVRGLVRAAFEGAADKRTVPGAAALLRGLLDADPSARVVILSGSPLQMRAVLEEKLRLDQVRWDHLVLKDNLGNLRRGRLKAVRGQVGYKLPHLLEDRATLSADDRETLFGDDSETDGLIYAAYAEAVAGRLDEQGLVEVLEAGGAYPDAITVARDALGRIARADAVDDIFIRIDRGVPLSAFRLLDRVTPVFSWFQAALVLAGRGRLAPAGLAEVARTSVRDPGLVAGLAQDAVRRGLVDRAALEALARAPGLETIARGALRAVDHLGAPPAPPPRRERSDFLGFLHAIRTH